MLWQAERCVFLWRRQTEREGEPSRSQLLLGQPEGKGEPYECARGRVRQNCSIISVRTASTQRLMLFHVGYAALLSLGNGQVAAWAPIESLTGGKGGLRGGWKGGGGAPRTSESGRGWFISYIKSRKSERGSETPTPPRRGVAWRTRDLLVSSTLWPCRVRGQLVPFFPLPPSTPP